MYYAFQPTDSDQLTEPVRKELEEKGHLPPRKVESFVQKLSAAEARPPSVRLKTQKPKARDSK